MDWTFKPDRPLYAQIVEKMRTAIACGDYAPGEKLPSVRESALEASVNPNTMQRAFAELERAGLVHSERTNGRFVTDEETTLDGLKTQLGAEIVADMCAHLRELKMSDEEIIAAVTKGIEGGAPHGTV